MGMPRSLQASKRRTEEMTFCCRSASQSRQAVLLESIKQYAPECPVYLRGPESVIENFEVDFKIYGQPRNFGDDYNEIIFSV